MEEITLKAHAKLNLSLEITGKREDGYHNIASLMQGIGIFDVVSVKKCPSNATKYNLPHCKLNGHVVYLCTNVKTIPTGMDNLAFKGIAAFIEAVNGNLPETDYEIEIDKRLPVAAGIAGGSGNAAAAMLGINAVSGYPLSLRELMSAGSKVGADVPFSLFMNAARNKDALAELKGIDEAEDAAMIYGIGDVVEGRKPVPRYVIMANPGISVSTPEAYRVMDDIGFAESKRGSGRLFINDMEKYTLTAYAEAGELKSLMEEYLSADEVLMSGSGPTIAAYYKDAGKAKNDAKILEEALRGRDNIKIWLTSTGIDQKEM